MPQDDVPLYRSRFPGFEALARADEWDDVTRELVLDRLRNVPPIRFFAPHEVDVLRALADVVVPQDDRPPERRVPLVEPLDERLHEGNGRGYRYASLPPDPEFWRLVVEALDDEARLAGEEGFDALSTPDRDALFGRVAAEDVRSAVWRRIPLRFGFGLLVSEFVAAYYAHPYAWDEIGWAGPKFPRVYVRTARDNPEEAQEARP